MRWDGWKSGNVEDRRGIGGPIALGGGGLGVLAIVVISMLLGADPRQVLDQVGGGQTQQVQQRQPGQPRADDQLAAFSSAVLGSTEQAWQQEFSARGSTYEEPRLVLYDGATQTGCGGGQAAMGPFYCPLDRRIYLDLTFFRELDQRFGAPGDFAGAYVIAHEVGHHVQTLLGVSDRVRAAQQRGGRSRANALSVRMELQADCLAGVWAHHANAKQKIIEPGDVEEGIRAASAVGDDTLSRASGRAITPDAFTHGSSAERVEWFQTGYQSGRMEVCDTFNTGGV